MGEREESSTPLQPPVDLTRRRRSRLRLPPGRRRSVRGISHRTGPQRSLLHDEWEMIRRLRQGGEDKGSVAFEVSSRPHTPVPESDESYTLTDHEDFVEVQASYGSSPLDRELRGSPVRSVIADEPAPPVGWLPGPPRGPG